MSASKLNSSTPPGSPLLHRSFSGSGMSSSLTGSSIPGGGKSEMGKMRDQQLVVQIFNDCCLLPTSSWMKIFATVTLIVSVALTVFLTCYQLGVFHFERFIGPVGTISTLTAAGTMVLLSGILIFLSFRKGGGTAANPFSGV